MPVPKGRRVTGSAALVDALTMKAVRAGRLADSPAPGRAARRTFAGKGNGIAGERELGVQLSRADGRHSGERDEIGWIRKRQGVLLALFVQPIEPPGPCPVMMLVTGA